MADYQLAPTNEIQEKLQVEGYRVFWRPAGIRECVEPYGTTIYYGESESDAWTAAYRHNKSINTDTKHTTTDCRTETGITVGLIDAVITMVRLLAQRDLSSPEVQEALKDLRSDEELHSLLHNEDVK